MSAEFDQFADDYDFWVRTARAPQTFTQLVDLLPHQDCRILDIGCGTGQLSIYLAQHSAHVTGIDPSVEMLALARKHRAAAHVHNVQFNVASIEDWVTVGEKYDFIVANYVLHYTNLAYVLAHLPALLNPSGRVLIRDIHLDDPKQPQVVYSERQRALWETPALLRAHGIYAASRILRFRLSSAWLDRQRHDGLLHSADYQVLYKRHLPECQMLTNGAELTVLWEAPPEQPKAETDNLSNVYANVPPVQYEWTDTRFPKTNVESTVVAIFEATVATHGARLAIKTTDRALTYTALNSAANRLAHAILRLCGAAAEPVIILAGDNVDVITAIFAVLKAGKIYVVLNPVHPLEQLLATITDATARLVLTDQQQATQIAPHLGADVQLLKLTEVDETLSAENLSLPLTPDHVAGIFYTSGSTGKPKGIIRQHRQLLHSTWHNTNAYGISAEDRHSLLFFCGYTAAVPDLYDTLLNGATLYPFDPQTHTLDELATWLEAEKITLFHPPAALFRRLLDALAGENRFPALRLVILAGQKIYKSDVELFRTIFHPSCLLLYRLAMTEAGSVTHFLMNHNTAFGAAVPVGYPTVDKEIVLLDDEGQPTAVPEGEIAIRSRYLSAGYWRNDALNAEKFLPDASDPTLMLYRTGDIGRLQDDGCLEILGRRDSMVKLRGYRVELGAIEQALNNLSFVKEAAVIVQDGPQNVQQLSAYLVPAGQSLTARDLRYALQQSLPPHMIPTHYIFLAELPLNANGKIDRQALPALSPSRPALSTAYAPPTDASQAELITLWESLFGINPIGIHDDFFEIGGSSLTVLHLLAEIKKGFDVTIPIELFLQEPTIGNLSTLLQTLLLNERATSLALQPATDAAIQTMAQRIHNRQVREKTTVNKLTTLSRLLPYPLAVRLCTLPSRPQNRALTASIQIIKAFHALIDTKVTLEQTIENSLHLKQMRALGLDHDAIRWQARGLPFAGDFRIEGRERIVQATASGQGIIFVNYHCVVREWTNAALGNNFKIVGAGKYQGDDEALPISKTVTQTLQLKEAQQILLAGGRVVIAADGSGGEGAQIEYPLHGRLVPIKTTFAELALMCNAIILPVYSVIHKVDNALIHIGEPFDRGASRLSYDERVKLLTAQYGAFLQDVYARAPWMISHARMKKHIACPPWAGAGEGVYG